MRRAAVPSMSFPAFLDAVFTPRVVGVTNYIEIDRLTYEATENPTDGSAGPGRSLRFQSNIEVGALPPMATGVYHHRFPCARLTRPLRRGDELAPHLAGRFFAARSFSVLDLDDPSLGRRELEGGAVWTLGIDYEGYLRPIYNALAYEGEGGMHPLRSTRQLGAPSCLFIYQPFADTPLDQCSVTLKHHAELGFRSNLGGWTRGGFNYVEDYVSALPALRLRFGGGLIPENGQADIEVEVVDAVGQRIERDVDLRATSTGGYLPLREVTARGGVGRFRVCATSLPPGSSFDVCVGIGARERLLEIKYHVGNA